MQEEEEEEEEKDQAKLVTKSNAQVTAESFIRIIRGSFALGMYTLFHGMNEKLEELDVSVRLPIWWEKPDKEQLENELRFAMMSKEKEYMERDIDNFEERTTEESVEKGSSFANNGTVSLETKEEVEELFKVASLKAKIRRLSEELDLLEKDIQVGERKEKEEKERGEKEREAKKDDEAKKEEGSNFVRNRIPSPRERRMTMIQQGGYVHPYTLEPMEKSVQEDAESETQENNGRSWWGYVRSFWGKDS